jgi:hypothetical protein
MIFGIPIAYFSIIFIILFIFIFIIWMKVTRKISLKYEVIKLNEFPFRLSSVVLTKKDEYENYLRENGFKLDSIYYVKLNKITDKYIVNYLSNNKEVLAVITIINSTIYITLESKFENGLSLVLTDFKDYYYQNNVIFLQRKLFISYLLKEHLLNSEFLNSKKITYKDIAYDLKESIKNEMSFLKENDLYFESEKYIHPKFGHIFKRMFVFIGIVKVGNDKILKPYIDEYYKIERPKLNIDELLSLLKEVNDELVEESSEFNENISDLSRNNLVKTEIKPIIVKEGYGIKDNLGTLLGAGLLSFILYNIFTSFSFFNLLSTKNLSNLFFILPIVVFLVFFRFLLLVIWELIRFKTIKITDNISETLSILYLFKKTKKLKLSDFKLIEFSEEKFREKFYHLKLAKEDYVIPLISSKNHKEFLRYKEILELNYPDLYKTLIVENKKRKINIKSIIITTILSIIFLLVVFFFNITTIGDTLYLKGKVYTGFSCK